MDRNMTQGSTKSQFDARLLRPKTPGNGNTWAFVVLPKDASAKLPRRGRTTVEGTINGQDFKALLEPDVPTDMAEALQASPEARATWDNTTTIARLDWIHWITSAKQAKTRAKRVNDACDMLASGKKRVCCFDPSGFYSKAFSAPQAVKAAL